MKRQNKALTLMVYTALLTAITYLCTMLLRIPVGADCYIHLGDAVIFTSVIMLPRKYACFAGTIGAVLADLSVLPFWAPWTFCCKLILVLVFGFFIDRASKSLDSCRRIGNIPVLEIVGYVLSSILMVAGYFFSELYLFGNWIEAGACVGFNMLQALIGAVLAVIVTEALKKTNIREMMYYVR